MQTRTNLFLGLLTLSSWVSLGSSIWTLPYKVDRLEHFCGSVGDSSDRTSSEAAAVGIWREGGWAAEQWWRGYRTEAWRGRGYRILGSAAQPWRGRDSAAGEAETGWSWRWISQFLCSALARDLIRIYLFPRRQLSSTCPSLPLIFPGVFPNQEYPSSFCWYLASEGHTLTTVSWHCPEMENIFYKEKKIFWYKYAEPSVYNVSGSHNYATSEFQWKIFSWQNNDKQFYYSANKFQS